MQTQVPVVTTELEDSSSFKIVITVITLEIITVDPNSDLVAVSRFAEEAHRIHQIMTEEVDS